MDNLTAQDIRNVTFEKGMRGYQTEDVDAFLEQIANQLETVEREKEETEKKVYRLAQMVSDYRKDEDNLKAALLNAQRMGDNIIQEATSRGAQIVREAEVQAQAIVGQASAQIDQQRNELGRLQEEVGRFKNSILALYRQHIESLSTLPEPARAEEPAEEEKQPETIPAKTEEVKPDAGEKLSEPAAEALL